MLPLFHQNHNQTSHLCHEYTTYRDLAARAPLTLPLAIIGNVVFGGKADLEHTIFHFTVFILSESI